MGNLLMRVLSLAVGIFFIVVGIAKMTPALNDAVHRELKKQFVRFVQVFPLRKLTGWKPTAQLLRKIVGTNEVVCGVMIAFLPMRMKQLATLILLAQMVQAIYLHWMAGDSLERGTPAVTFAVLNLCHFVALLQDFDYDPLEEEEGEEGEDADDEAEEEVEDDEKVVDEVEEEGMKVKKRVLSVTTAEKEVQVDRGKVELIAESLRNIEAVDPLASGDKKVVE